jgi:hypothetical protein
MAKRNFKKHLIRDNTNFQAVCSKGDYFGPYEQDKHQARKDAASHNAKPGCENHIVNIVQTTTVVRPFMNRTA